MPSSGNGREMPFRGNGREMPSRGNGWQRAQNIIFYIE